MKRPDVEVWLARYEQAWRTAGTTLLGELFTVDATYQQSPYAERLAGLTAIAAMWEAEREGPDEGFMASTVLALDGNVAVVRVEVAYEEALPRGVHHTSTLARRFRRERESPALRSRTSARAEELSDGDRPSRIPLPTR